MPIAKPRPDQSEPYPPNNAATVVLARSRSSPGHRPRTTTATAATPTPTWSAGQTGASAMLDWETLTGQNIEQKLSRLCDMVIKAERLNIAYGLKLPGNTIDPDQGEAHRQKCLKALALHALPTGES